MSSAQNETKKDALPSTSVNGGSQNYDTDSKTKIKNLCTSTFVRCMHTHSH
jgi:hypothetical protein